MNAPRSNRESALVVLVPEADALVAPFRVRYDPGAANGMPAHVTVLYPFKPPDEIDDATFAGLREVFGRCRPFDFSLANVRQFPGEALYLAPEPGIQFTELTRAVSDRFPGTPPYGGRHAGTTPHLTVALLRDPRRTTAIVEEFAHAARGKLPLRCRAAAAALFDTSAGYWRLRAAFPFSR